MYVVKRNKVFDGAGECCEVVLEVTYYPFGKDFDGFRVVWKRPFSWRARHLFDRGLRRALDEAMENLVMPV